MNSRGGGEVAVEDKETGNSRVCIALRNADTLDLVENKERGG